MQAKLTQQQLRSSVSRAALKAPKTRMAPVKASAGQPGEQGGRHLREGRAVSNSAVQDCMQRKRCVF